MRFITNTTRCHTCRASFFTTDPYIEHLLDGVVDFAREQRWALNAMMRRSGRLPEGVRPDGIIATIDHDNTARRLARFRCPVVQILRIRDETRYPLVIPDCTALGATGARHLLTAFTHTSLNTASHPTSCPSCPRHASCWPKMDRGR